MKAISILGLASLLTAGVVFASTGHDTGHAAKAKAATRVVKLDASEYAFSAKAISFKAGETIKFVITNKGKQKHALTIGTAAEQAEHRAEMEKMAAMNHDEAEHGMPANSIHVAPGETRELVWSFAAPGQLLFACSYPGHADLGMTGDITVR
jgi:uncharacterized cupredoxin-like copper-binding protein